MSLGASAQREQHKMIEVREPTTETGWSCHVVAHPMANAEVVDGSALVDSLWSAYSANLWERLKKTFPPDLLLKSGFPLEIIENHLLVEVYYPRAFPALLASRIGDHLVQLAEQTTPMLDGRRVWALKLPPTAGPIPELAERVQQCLQSRHSQTSPKPPRNSVRSKLIGWAGFALGFAETLRGVIQISLAGDSIRAGNRAPLPQNLFLLFNGLANHTRHVWQLLESPEARPAASAVLLLGHRLLDSELREKAKACGLRIVALVGLRDVVAAGWRLLWSWPRIQHLQLRAERDLGLTLELRFQAQSAAWWLRGFLHERSIKSARFENPEATLAVFGLIAHVDTRMADLALRKRGVRTVHWLHGIVESAIHYRANATACLCQNQVDANLRTRHGNYELCLTAHRTMAPGHFSKTNQDTKSQGLLLLTNLLHPDNRFIGTGGPNALVGLLHLVSDYARSKQLTRLTWRPHPRVVVAPEFPKFQKVAARLGFLVDNTSPLTEQVEQHEYIVSTFSGSVGDVAAAGKVPAVYAGLPYESEGHWGHIPNELKFHTLQELTTVFGRFNHTTLRHWGVMLRQQYQRPEPSAATVSEALIYIRNWQSGAQASAKPAPPT